MFQMNITPMTGATLNGFQTMVKQSEVDADKVIASFQENIYQGYPQSLALEKAFKTTGVLEANLTDFDKERIKRKVEAVTTGYYNKNWR